MMYGSARLYASSPKPNFCDDDIVDDSFCSPVRNNSKSRELQKIKVFTHIHTFRSSGSLHFFFLCFSTLRVCSVHVLGKHYLTFKFFLCERRDTAIKCATVLCDLYTHVGRALMCCQKGSSSGRFVWKKSRRRVYIAEISFECAA